MGRGFALAHDSLAMFDGVVLIFWHLVKRLRVSPAPANASDAGGVGPSE